MRFYARTGRNTGMSVGPVGAVILALLVVALPIYASEMIFSTWWSATIAGVVVVVLGLGWALTAAENSKWVARRIAEKERPDR